MKWILIVFFINIPTLTIEFDSEQACMKTALKLEEEKRLGVWLYYCEEKK